MASSKPCIVDGCGKPTKRTRCNLHERERDDRTERGYGAPHRRLRAQYQRRMDAGERFTCWRCGKPVDLRQWTLGHCDDDRSQYHGPECPPCDYATTGRGACPHPSHPGGTPLERAV